MSGVARKARRNAGHRRPRSVPCPKCGADWGSLVAVDEAPPKVGAIRKFWGKVRGKPVAPPPTPNVACRACGWRFVARAVTR